MAALSNTAGHYIFVLWFLLSSFFFPRLFSAVTDWMSTILPHMVWPYCEFRMQVWNVLHAPRWKYRTQESPKIRHLPTIAQLCRAISPQLRHIDSRRKIVKQQSLPHMSSQYGELRPTSGWDRFVSLGHPSKFNGFRVLASLLQRRRSMEASQTLRRWTEGATCVRQGDHHVGHWPTFLVKI